MINVKEILMEMNPDVDYDTCDTLIDDGILESLDIITFIAEVASEFDVEIPVEEIIPENFNSLEALNEMINRLDD